jgi:uncharacterized protein YkwD
MHDLNSLSRYFMLFLAAVIPAWLFQTFPPSDPGQPRLGEPVFTYSMRAGNLLENRPNYSGCTAASTPVLNGEFEQEVVERVNAERAAQGLPPLKRSSQLDEAARYHAADMKADNYFDHLSYDRVNNQLQLVCNWSARLGNFYTGSSTVGENIAYGYRSPEDVMEGWMNSPGHRGNILSSSYTELGVGYGTGNHWVQDFGSRPDIHPVIINNEAGTTDSGDVTLFVYGSWQEIRIRSDGGPWSSWMPFQKTLAWQLPDQAGSHTITVEMRSGTKTETSSDEIVLGVGKAPPPPAPSEPSLYLPFLVNPIP